MIEDVKWLKPGDYNIFGNCWIAKDGKVIEGFCDTIVSKHFKYIAISRLNYIIPDGVCERKPNQEKPVLR